MKHNIQQLTGIAIALIALSVGGSVTSSRIRAGTLPFWTQFFFTFGMACVWMYQIKYSKSSLLFSSAFYDIITCTTWLGMLAWMGEPLELKQKAGLLFAFIGIILMA
jgi:drug/metabolite transporter (DMT)-like permease